MKFETITKAQFRSYEAVRTSGKVNMFEISNVQMLSGLDRETIITIMYNYEKLMEKFPGVRE